MNIIEDMKGALKRWREDSRKRRAAKQTALLRVDAQAYIQCREFDGRIFLAYRNLPLVEVTRLKAPIAEELTAARKTYVEYYLEDFKDDGRDV